MPGLPATIEGEIEAAARAFGNHWEVVLECQAVILRSLDQRETDVGICVFACPGEGVLAGISQAFA